MKDIYNNLLLIILSTLILQIAYAQINGVNNSPINLKEIFKECKPPISIDHFNIIRDTISPYDVREFIDSNYLTIYSNNKILDTAEFNRFFFSVDSITSQNIWDLKDGIRRSKEKYYKTHRMSPLLYFNINDSISAFIIEDNDGKVVQNILYTVNKEGKMIAKLPLSFYMYSGFGIHDFYPNKFSRITTSFIIRKFDGNSFGKNAPELENEFLISPSGQIVKK